MIPPIYQTNLSGTAAQQFLHRARMFRDAACLPALPDYRNGEPFWPKYALLTHAIELALKAFALHHSVDIGRGPGNHDLRGWYNVALQHGHGDNPAISENIDKLNDLHSSHYSRYPQRRPVPDASVIADSTVEHLISTFTQLINPR